ncbi:hypothetical protein [Kitasatospora sp. NPDC048407]|uniref:hypothetical protein n=1 Tax=Kitasatospora sp. NPDC048407 TaxID=3364051 RepID=UPI00371A5627
MATADPAVPTTGHHPNTPAPTLQPRRSNAARPVSVLVDGMDLTGKTTLTRLLVEELQTTGLRVLHHRGCLAEHHPQRRWLERTVPGHRPASSRLNAAFIASAILDGPLPGVLDDTRLDVIVQESYVDRAVAYGVAAGNWPAARWATRHPELFPRFDLALITRAAHAVRLRRMAGRTRADGVDAATVADAAFESRFYRALDEMVRRHRRVRRIDTNATAPERAAGEAADLVRQLTAARAATSRGPAW